MFALTLLRCCLIGTAVLDVRPAQPNEVDVTVTVVDSDLRPVAAASVESAGDATTRILGRTDSTGVVAIRAARGERLRARAGSAVSSIEIVMSPALRFVVSLPSIASVTARMNDPDERTTAASARALLSGDVAGALGYVPNYRSAAQGGSGRQSLNGVALDLPAPPEGASASGGIPSDLISSFDAVQADDGSYPDYHLLSPTADFTATLSAGATSYDGSRWKATAAGPHGNLHYALALAAGADDGTLAGRTFVDQSGVRYDHGTGARHDDASLTGNSTFGPVNVSFLGFDARRAAAYVGANQPGAIVQGLGPGNRIDEDNGLEFVLATWSRGRDSYSAIDGRYGGGGTFDFSLARIAGAAVPSYSGYRYSGSFDRATWTRTFSASSMSVNVGVDQNESRGFSGEAGAFSQRDSDSVRTGSRTFGLSYRVGHDDAKAGASLTARSDEGAFAGSFLEAAAFAGKRIAGTDARISVSTTQAQSEEAGYATASTLDPPQKATLTCAPATATVSGPAAAGTTHPRSRTLALSLARSGEAGSIRAGAFRSDVSNALVLADVGGFAFPAGYVTALDTFFDTLCPGQTLPGADTFVQRYETVSVLRQAQWYVDATRRFGPLSFEAFYETFTDALAQTPAGLAGTRTTLVAGAQLANVPLHRAGLTVAYARRTMMVAIGARFISAGNDANLPGHVAPDAGLRVQLGRGTLETSVQNMFGAYAGTFNSPRYALPLLTTGAPLATLATPLPRTWTLRCTVATGPR